MNPILTKFFGASSTSIIKNRTDAKPAKEMKKRVFVLNASKNRTIQAMILNY